MASAWGRGQSVPRTVPDTDKDRKDRHFGLCINFYDGEAAAAGKNGNSYQYLEFGADTDSWQYLNGAAVAKQKYTKIQVMYCTTGTPTGRTSQACPSSRRDTAIPSFMMMRQHRQGHGQGEENQQLRV